MQTIKDAANDFLSQKRIAVTGVSRTPANHGSNVVYQRLRERGYEVFAVNPNTEQVEGDRCYPNLKSIPGGVDGVVIATRPERAEQTVEECAELGISRVWMHRTFGAGSVSEEATAWGRAHGMTVIDGGCPLMFEPASDGGHKMMRWMFSLNGHVPHKV
ncbi:MAG: CoA-binding protein [Nocardioidaceae bacterium]